MDDTRTTDALEELARLYLTGREDDAHPTPEDDPGAVASPATDDPPPTGCEALWLGHVPGLANPWVSQYAHRLARTSNQPVLLLRMQADHLTLDRFDPGEEHPPATPPREDPTIDPEDLDGTLRRLARITPALLLHADTNAPPEATALLRRAAKWTLLTGADQAALVAGYRLLKAHFDSLGEGDLPEVGFLLLGTPAGRATTAASKLAATIERFLQVKPRPLGAQQKMVPTSQRTLTSFAYADHPDWADTLVGFLDDLRSGAFQPAASSTLNDLEREMLEDEAYRFPGASTTGTAEPTTESADAQWQADPPDVGQPVYPAPDQLEPETSHRVETRPHHTADRPTLTDLVDALKPLGVTCPYADSVLLAVDQTSRLHLLIDAQQHDIPAGATATLMLVERWAADHRGLLNAIADQPLADTPPVAHLFTAEPAAFHRLAALGELGGTMPLHLHLLRHDGDHWTHHRIT